MEDLWTSLTAEESTFPLSVWHRSELLKTEARVASGQEEFIDWEDAKKSLRRRAK
jgi:hypothetical protein